MSGTIPWQVIHRHGSAVELFDADWFDRFDSVGAGRAVVRLHPLGPAIVLGSSQRHEVVDENVAGVLGVDVVRRRSGGGAVWLDDTVDWFDIVLPSGDPLIDPDVQVAFYWLGELFAEVLTNNVGGNIAVHHGALARDPVNKLLCFGGLGPGEVTRNGRKVMGISQRRTRRYTLFQCGILRSWDPAPLVRALRPGLVAAQLVGAESGGSDSLVAALADRCAGVGRPDVVADIFTATLQNH